MSWKSKRNSGFTLVELLTVIAVLAILGTIIIGGARMMMRTARKRRFDTTKEVLHTALMRYRTEYNGWPVARASSADAAAKVTFKSDNYKLFDALRVCNKGTGMNPDEIRFLDETSVLTYSDGKAVPLSSASGNTENPIGYIPLSGKGFAYFEVTLDFDLDTVSVGPANMETGDEDDEY